MIKTLDIKSLRNNEHFQWSTEVKTLVEKYNPDTLKIKSLFVEYLKCYADEDEAMLVIRKSALSSDIVEADRKRDNHFRGFVDAVKAAQRHFDPEVVVAAKKIKILLDTIGNVVPMPNNQETALIYNLIQELKGAYKNEVALMKLGDWVARLEASNQHFEVLTRQRMEEASHRTLLKVKQTRRALDEQYKAIIARIESYINIGEGDLYVQFIAELNTIIDNYKNRLAQRKGRYNAQKEDNNSVKE